MAGKDGYFEVACCGQRRGMLPGAVLLCALCDYVSGRLRGGPEKERVTAAPDGMWFIYHPKKPEA